jgi:hypothetical protein
MFVSVMLKVAQKSMKKAEIGLVPGITSANYSTASGKVNRFMQKYICKNHIGSIITRKL